MDILKAVIMQKRKELEESHVLVCNMLYFVILLNYLIVRQYLFAQHIFCRRIIENILKGIN